METQVQPLEESQKEPNAQEPSRSSEESTKKSRKKRMTVLNGGNH